MRYSKAEVELSLKMLGFDTAKKLLKLTEADLKRLQSTSQRSFLVMSKLGMASLGA